MIDLSRRKEEFDHRHDFEGDDLAVLKERHPNVEIKNIPTAWLLIVDEMLCAFKDNQAITEVSQYFGHLCVSFKNRPEDQGRFEKHRDKIAIYEAKIRAIDIDLNHK